MRSRQSTKEWVQVSFQASGQSVRPNGALPQVFTPVSLPIPEAKSTDVHPEGERAGERLTDQHRDRR
jgi:hypothetical protein